MADRSTGVAAPRRTRSVRFRVTALATLLVVVTLVVTGVALVIAQRQLLVDGVEETIERRADDAVTLLANPGSDPAGGRDDDTAAQIVAADGTVIASSPLLAGAPPVTDPPPAGTRQSLTTIEDPGELTGEYRALSQTVDTADGRVTIHVIGTLEDVAEAQRILVGSLLVAIPVVAAVLATMIWWLVGRTIQPVEAIRVEVADISGSDLHRRVPEPGTGDEIDRLAHTMNAMLDRVEVASEEQRRFVADASHELRSPLTRIRADLEVNIAHPDTADPGATYRSMLEETTALQRLVEDLLQLARGGGSAPVMRAVDLDDLVLDEASRVPGNLNAVTDNVESARVTGTPEQLRRAVRNVVDNAVRHATSTITFELRRRGDVAQLSIADDGPGIRATDREVVFERFTRLDEARTRDGGGTGLGLAITRDIVERHGGSIVATEAGGGGARFDMTLPIGPGPSAEGG